MAPRSVITPHNHNHTKQRLAGWCMVEQERCKGRSLAIVDVYPWLKASFSVNTQQTKATNAK